MKLTRKLSLALILGILLVLTANAGVRFRREIALFDRDSRRDSLLIGRMSPARWSGFGIQWEKLRPWT